MRLHERFCLKGTYNLEQKKAYPWLELFCAFTAAVSFFCIGAARSYTSPAILSIQQDIGFNITLTRNDISWVASSPPFVAFFGALISAPLLQYAGRQKTLILQAIPCTLGWLLIGFATNLSMILVGRGLTGLSSGIATSTAQLYVSELARAKIRGMLGFLPGMMLSLGVLAGLIAGTVFHWRLAAFVLAVAPTISIIFTIPLPESPTWLMMKERESEALGSLRRIRGAGRDKKIKEEISQIKESMKETQDAFEKLRWRDVIKRRDVYWPTCLVLSLMVFQQFSGVSAIIFYLGNILEDAEKKSGGVETWMNPEQGAILVGVVQFLAFFISLPLIDWLGRKVSLLTSSFFMILSHISLGFYFYSCGHNKVDIISSTAPWLPLVSLCCFIASFSIGFASVPFIVASEVFPSHLRSILCSLASFVNLICVCLTVKFFLPLKDALPEGYIFFLYGIVCVIAIIVVILAMPETKGKSLAQIQALFQGPEPVCYYNESFEPSADDQNSFSDDPHPKHDFTQVDCQR